LSRQVIIYAKSVKSHLSRLSRWGLKGTLFEIDGVEEDKSIEVYLKIVDFLIEQDFKKSDLLVAVGGGSLLDLVGFVAATYMRGVDVAFVPTTLLAMVDASIGGKNGINRPWGKNIIGTTYLPKKTFLDMFFLSSVPLEQLYPGYVEMLKIAVVEAFSNLNRRTTIADDKEFSTFLEGWEFPPSDKCIEKARTLKQAIIDQDLNEQGRRYLLNFGHTIGHALEAYLNYGISHGEAVQHGMVVEMELLGFPKKLQKKILSYFPFKSPFPKIEPELFKNILLRDKKNSDGRVAISNVLDHNNKNFLTFMDPQTVVEACMKRNPYDCLHTRA